MAGNDLGAGEALGGHLSTLMNWTGALMSLGLVAGLTVWGYQLTVRDVSGVPVVRALEGPMRVAPDDPGGLQAAHQGLAVNAVTAEGGAATPADRLVLAPSPPELADDDLTPVAMRAAPASEPEADPEDDAEYALAEDADSGEDGLAPAENVETLSAEIAPLAPEPAAEAAALALVPASVPGVRRSPRPLRRPNVDLAALAVAASVARTVAPAQAGLSPEDLPTGTSLAQLGAFETADLAEAEWQDANGRFSDYLDGKGRLIQRAESGGKTFFRLRVLGFADLSEARRFCSALLSEGANCIPVVTR